LPHETGTAAFPTPTSAYNQPGTYPFFGRCTVIQVPETTVTVDMCLVGVEVHQDGAMQFVVAWTAHLAGSSYDYVEISGAGNPGVYITDDLGNRYDFFGLWGIAAATGYLDDNETGYGAYIFPPAHPGATTFTFHDDYQGIAIGGLVLIK
jgi:hypothetical protein